MKKPVNMIFNTETNLIELIKMAQGGKKFIARSNGIDFTSEEILERKDRSSLFVSSDWGYREVENIKPLRFEGIVSWRKIDGRMFPVLTSRNDTLELDKYIAKKTRMILEEII